MLLLEQKNNDLTRSSESKQRSTYQHTAFFPPNQLLPILNFEVSGANVAVTVLAVSLLYYGFICLDARGPIIKSTSREIRHFVGGENETSVPEPFTSNVYKDGDKETLRRNIYG
jgi:hypothetical protein